MSNEPTLTAMFPLGSPLLPGTAMPMQIFEPRYVTMIREQLAASDNQQPMFGVVMIERGKETGGGEQRADIATLAAVADLTATGDGRYLFVAAGLHRIRVVEWLDDDPYPRALTVPWPDEGPTGPEATHADVVRLRVAIEQLNADARALGDTTAPPDVPVAPTPERGLFQLAAIAPIADIDRYRVLAAAGPNERVTVLEAAVSDARSVLKFRRT